MTAPMCTARPPVPATLECIATPPLLLTPDEVRLVALYRATTDRWQEMTLSMAEVYADKFPRNARAALRLVSGGAA